MPFEERFREDVLVEKVQRRDHLSQCFQGGEDLIVIKFQQMLTQGLRMVIVENTVDG